MNPSRTCTFLAAALALAGLAVTGVVGQEGTPAVVETARVNVVNVDVVVTGRDGRPVQGLTAADFDLFEDGNPVPITNFYAATRERPAATPTAPADGAAEEVVAAPPSEEQSLRMVFFIDNANLTLARRAAVFEQIRALLRQGLRSGRTQVLLATSGGAVRVRQPFTADENTLLATVERLERETGEARLGADRDPFLARMISAGSTDSSEPGTGGRGRLRQDFEKENALSIREQALSAAEQAYQQTKVTLAALTQFIDSLAGLAGRKALVYVGEGVPMRPGEALLKEWEATFRRYDPTFNAVAEAGRFTVGREFGELLRRANSARVTFYCVDASADAGSAGVSAEQAFMTADPTSAIMSAASLRQSLESMAAVTGGRTLAAGPGLAAALASTVEDLGAYYSLGYEAPHLGDGKYHVITVKVKRENVRVRHREGYVDNPPDARSVERNLSALMFEGASNPLGLTIAISPGERQKGDTFQVTVTVTVPLGNLMFLPRGAVHEGSVSLWLATRDAEDRLSVPAKQVFPVRVPNDKLQTALGQTGSFVFKMIVRPGNQRVAVTVRDDLGQTESTAVAPFAPEQPAPGSS